MSGSARSWQIGAAIDDHLSIHMSVDNQSVNYEERAGKKLCCSIAKGHYPLASDKLLQCFEFRSKPFCFLFLFIKSPLNFYFGNCYVNRGG